MGKSGCRVNVLDKKAIPIFYCAFINNNKKGACEKGGDAEKDG
jgi:hypothetical protein